MSTYGNSPTEILQSGSKGPNVRKLHSYLKRFGYFPNERLSVFESWRPAIDIEMEDTERFDATLEEAVRLFQRQHGLRPDGVVGP
ncbi:MAG: peptidoglycan-binding domain-containing protein, partial [Pseudonocardiaceae bacterium]